MLLHIILQINGGWKILWGSVTTRFPQYLPLATVEAKIPGYFQLKHRQSFYTTTCFFLKDIK